MTRKKLLTVLRVAIAVVTLAAVVYAVARNWSDVSVHLDKISLPTFAWSTLAAAIGTWLTMLGWRTILRDLGSDLHLAPASGVYFVGQLGKYLPGSLWSVLVQADIAANLKVPRRRTAVTGLLALGFALLTGFLVGLPAASFLLNGSSGGFDWWLLLALPLLVVLCVPRLLNALIAWGLRLLRRPPLEHDLSTGAVLRAVATFIGVWLFFGVHTLLLARAVADGAGHDNLTVAAVTGYALSVSLGMLTIVLPAGLGAREGLLTLILSTAMPTPAAAAVAIMSRFIVTIVDVLVALGGWLYAKSHHLVSARREAVSHEEDLTV
ncbi:lysylphosphatidylglycerol synthase domain-containing protein [Intrasporangium flavum]|uniref:lysylphosphatidylglycerol synthase domain-containing protein n=1 Tax=Intrasporangium flavum TaxID=1428657 RepID=UPI00096BFA9B|nr:lysylphosphatidylglycerol synthase domain-containing protein [Intrasporangium flavum]